MESNKVNGVKFNRHDRPEFFKVLRKRVSSHFKDNNISTQANLNMKLKTAFMIGLYFIPFAVMLFGGVTSSWLAIGLWALMGFGMSGIGTSVMHDANHGSYSKNPLVNSLLGGISNFTGVYHKNWKIQHNVLHHSFTNIDGHDEDLKNAVLRFSPNQEHKARYKHQAFYAPFFYGIMTLFWVVSKDFQDLKRYRDENLLATQGMNYKSALTEVVLFKVGYVLLTLVLPIFVVAVPVWVTLVGFFIMHFITGLLLALIFQPAHVIEETQFYEPDETGSVENNWAIHQMKTTSNFAHKSRLLSWYIGGLNYQIEHHLFPNICHVHYKKISKIVKETAQEFGVPYYNHETFLDAIKSHFSLLHRLGTGEIDQEMKKQERVTEMVA
jgi:linoleoyl-CoA desaturase